MSRPAIALSIALLTSLLTGQAACADEEPTATPYRPTVSNPAELSLPGWLEIEAGMARTKGGGANWQNNMPWLAKVAFSEDFGVMLGSDLRVRQSDAGGPLQHGGGDSTLTFKHRWTAGDDAAFGLEWGAKLATAAHGLGTGKTDYGFTAIYSRDIGQHRIDANLGVTRLGLAEEGLARQQYPWAIAVSRPAGEDWTIALETSGVYRRGTPAASQLIAAASYGVTRRLVLDFGAATRLSQAGPQWLAFAGATYLSARLW